MPARPPIDPAIFDAEQFAVVQRMLSPERLAVHLQSLDQQLLAFADSPADVTLQDLAHKIVSQAGMLGLTRVSDCMRALEHACMAGDGAVDALRACRAAAEDVRLYAMPAAVAD